MSERSFLDEVLGRAIEVGASDVHFVACTPVRMRVAGELQIYDCPYPTPEQTQEMAVTILTRAGRAEGGESLSPLLEDQDCPYSVPGIGRFRANVFCQRGTTALVLRSIPVEIPSIEALGLPEVIDEVALEDRGLVLVTGMAGSGRSTTVAAMLSHMNAHRHCRIMTIEDPIEYVFRDAIASIVQREVGSDTRSFATALNAVLHQDPDVIFVGEMRDRGTVDVALKAAESGCLVISTLHTADSPKAINRLISFFEPSEHATIRVRLADCLRAVISQRLVPRGDGCGRLPLVEVMRVNNAMKVCILNADKTHTLRDYITMGRDEYGMQTYDQHLLDLCEAGEVSRETALSVATNAVDLERRMLMAQTA